MSAVAARRVGGRELTTIAGLGLLLLVGPVGILWAVGDGLTAYVGGKGDPSNVSGEWIGKGTLLSAPLVLLVSFSAALALARSRGRWNTLGAVATAGIAVVFLVGVTLEPLFPVEYERSELWVILYRLSCYTFGIAVLAGCVRMLRASVRDPAGQGVRA